MELPFITFPETNRILPHANRPFQNETGNSNHPFSGSTGMVGSGRVSP